MKIVIVGPGAIGSLWATHLHSAGHCVSTWSRHSEAQLTLELDDSTPISLLNNDIVQVQNADLLLVTLKAPLVESVLKQLASHIAPEAIIVLMHNGMGTAERVLKMLSENPLVLATTTHGAYRESKHKVLHTGIGQTVLGGFNLAGQRCDFLTEVFNHALPDCTWNPHITNALWHKLAINCAINPLTAINNISNGDLALPRYAEQVEKIVSEVVSVMQAEGLDIESEALTNTVKQVISATAKNHSSMQQDIFYQRQSEIDFITGYLLERAKQHKLSTPTNLALYNAVKQIEQGWNQQ
ncbi:2-dehydropantoate 2-reductase [Vibrio aquaticus]|uniref:2-dehydropantoate 2-reductase n=1 Tax=Vibrio aquaticus TaxID=2496559 RepID=A0A432CWC5_9VIBR|nr:2-dehydropantoate 2-reductase [Vibrio aquaticus]RTZ16064.1 2-dehydropantoate 2-reductase [Vibrio aquaticus]